MRCHASAYGDRPVDPGRDDPMYLLGPGQPLDPSLVFRGDEGTPVGVPEADGARVPVAGDDVETAFASGAEEPELRGPCA
jgi:hypothetical protein